MELGPEIERVVIKFLVRAGKINAKIKTMLSAGKTNAEIKTMLSSAYGASMLGCLQLFEWIGWFQEGKELIRDVYTSTRCITCVDG